MSNTDRVSDTYPELIPEYRLVELSRDQLVSEIKKLREALNNELADVSMLCDHLSVTYSHFSEGRISKPQTLPEEVIRIAGDLESERWAEYLKEEMESV